MKTLFALILLLFSITANAQVLPESKVTNTGLVVVRFFNSTPLPVWCYFRDQHNYFTFVIQSNMYSMWYPAYGMYEWRCVFSNY